MTTERKPVPAGYWWNSAVKMLDDVIHFALLMAKKAERREHPDHECGHEWTIIVKSRGHSSGAGDDPTHSDANYTDECEPVTVRAHNLKAALLLAADKPLTAWFKEEI